MPPALLLSLVAQVRRRVVAGSLLRMLVWACLIALGLSAAWILLQRLALPRAAPWLVWLVPGLSLLAAAAFAAVVSLMRAPSPLGAAMTLDERFGLRERVTTSLTLDPESAATPAGQALLADAEQRAKQVRVADRFPVAVPWKPAALLPVSVAAVLLLALFLPQRTLSGKTDEEQAAEQTPLEPSKAVEEQMKKLAQKKLEAKKADEQPKAEDLRRIEAEIDKFVQKPRDKRDEVQDRIKDATAIEEELKRQQKRQEERQEALRQALKQNERLREKTDKQQDGPAKDAADALKRGDLNQMKDELARLGRALENEQKKEDLKKQLEDPNLGKDEKDKLERELDKLEKDEKPLTDKEKEDLEKQLAEMKEQIDRLTQPDEDRQKDLEDRIANEGDKDKREALQKELEQLKDNQLTDEEKKELEELAKELGECKKCMGEGKNGKAGKSLAAAAKKAEQLNKEGDAQQRAKLLREVRNTRRELNRQMAAGGEGGPAAGKRPEAKDDVKEEEKHLTAEWDRGKVNVVGSGPKGGKKFEGPRKREEMAEEIKQATQESAAAIDRQRLPPAARNTAREYFEKVRGQDKEKDAKKP